MISLNECKNGFLYQIKSRNLSFGIFTIKNKGFVGIREKFGREYLFTEYHYETGPPFGTVTPIKEFESVPEEISLEEIIKTIDNKTNRIVAFDKPVSEGGKGWYYVDTGKSSSEIFPVGISNNELFAWLKAKEKQYYKRK
jgi:hypothetical protein